jgi:hypothetical protein
MPCHEICVLVDADGYASSLMERGAARVGRDYTLIPVLAPGVFHPKCTYLSGPDGDLLLVGSGNLTFGGYGKNVEVLEVLQPEVHPRAFLDFADFLEALTTRPKLEIPNPGSIHGCRGYTGVHVPWRERPSSRYFLCASQVRSETLGRPPGKTGAETCYGGTPFLDRKTDSH